MSWLGKNEMLQSFTFLQLDDLIALYHFCTPQAMNDLILVPVKPSAPLHVRETRFCQSAFTASSRGYIFSVKRHPPLPCREVRLRHALRLCLSVAAKPVLRAPACLSFEARCRLPPCAFPSSQSLGPAPHGFRAASGKH